MKILKYIIFAIFASFLSCKETTKSESINKKYVKLFWKNTNFDWMPSSLISSNNQLYFADLNNNFYSVNIENAKVLLNFKTDYNPIHKPLIFDKNLYLTEYGTYLNCFDSTGKLKWKINGEINLRYDLAGYNKSIYGSVQGNGFSKINKDNGKVMWFLPKDSNTTQTNRPIFADETIYLGFSELTASILAIDNENGKIKWKNSFGNFETIRQYKTDEGLLILLNKDFKNGNIKMLNYEDGSEIWSKSINCDLHYEPTIINDNAIFSTYENNVISLNIKNGKIKWSLKLKNDQLETNLINYKEDLYFGTINRKLYSLNKKSGKINFTEQFYYGISTPIIENNKIYFPAGASEMWILK